jgi:PAS domain S-box-containing protein
MIWRTGTDKRCNWVNKPWLDFVGRSMEQELGDGWAENIHEDDAERSFMTYVTSFDARQPFSMTYRVRRRDGVYRHILDNGAPFNRGGEFAGYFGSAIDVTEQMAAEAQLRQAQKMEAVSGVASRVAHDVSNILQIIGSNLELLSLYVAGDPQAEELLEDARVGLARGTKLTSQLQALGRPQASSPAKIGDLFGIHDVLRRAVGETALDKAPAIVLGDGRSTDVD